MSWRPKRLTRGQMAERRREGFKLLSRGKLLQKEVAEELGVSQAIVSRWSSVLRKKGMRGARATVSKGRPAKLESKQRKSLLGLLKEGALQAGFPTERWTQQRIQKVIEREFGVTYHPNYIGRLLGQLGWSLQKPQPQPREQDDELVRAWLAQDWPRIKKSAANRGNYRVY